MPTKYPEEFQLKVVYRYECGIAIPELCQEFNIAMTTAYRWINQHRTIHTLQHTYTPFEFGAVSRRLKKLEHELEITRLTHYHESIPLHEKLENLAQLHSQYEEYSVHELCETLGCIQGHFL